MSDASGTSQSLDRPIWPNTIAQFEPAVGLRSVIAGIGSVRRLLAGELDRQTIARPMIVCGAQVSQSSVLGLVSAALGREAVVYDGCRPHVPQETIDAGAALARAERVDGLIAIGGSSAVDCAKGIGVLLAGGIPSMTALKPIDFSAIDVGFRPPSAPRVPLVTITGTLSYAEFTGFFGACHRLRKRAYMDQNHVTRTIILDGEIAAATPASVWAETGIKALDDALFSFCGHERPEPFFDPLLVTSLRMLVDLLPASTRTADPVERQHVQTAVWITKSHLPRFDRPSYTGWFSTACRHSLGAVLNLPHGIGSCVALLPGLRFHLPTTRRRQAMLAAALGWPVADDPERSPLEDGLTRLMAAVGVPTKLETVKPGALEEVVAAMLEESAKLGSAEALLAACRTMV